MSPTLAKKKPQPKPEPATRRARLEIVTDALERDEQALAAARTRFVELAAAEDQAVREAKRANPEANAYALRSPAQQIREERAKLEKTLDGLERGIAALQSERVAAAAEQAARELAERTKEAKRLADRERELRREAAESFAALVTRWNALAEVLTERSSLVSEVALAELVQQVGIFDRQTVERWQEASGFTVEPVPVDLRSFIDEALEAALGERPDDDDGGALAAMNRQRAAVGLVAELRHVSPSARELAEAYPDLRGEVRTAEVSGANIRRHAEPETGWPGGAAA
jgi:DNA repair exonuclease SbcCD ATPase subunit